MICTFCLVGGFVKCCCAYDDVKDNRGSGCETTCMMVLGTAILRPSCSTASTKRWCSLGVHTSRGRFSARASMSSPSSARAAEQLSSQHLSSQARPCASAGSALSVNAECRPLLCVLHDGGCTGPGTISQIPGWESATAMHGRWGVQTCRGLGVGPLGSGLRCAAGWRVRLLILLRLGVPLLLLLLLRMLLLLLHCACSRQKFLPYILQLPKMHPCPDQE